MTVRIGVLVAGRYRVERQIGSGGMGAVWLARDERLDRPVALKRAHPATDERRLRELSREARIAGGIEHPRECDQTLTLADGHIVAVTAQLTGKGKIDLCAAATVAADYTAAKLVHGVVPRRARSLPTASLANQDACGLLTKTALTRVHAGRAEPGFARWGCRWAATDDTDIQLRFDRNGPLSKDDGRRVRFAGRDAFIQAGGDGQGTCVAQVVHRTYVDTSGQKTAEIVFLVVSGKPSESRLCTKATSLASAASARPPAT